MDKAQFAVEVLSSRVFVKGSAQNELAEVEVRLAVESHALGNWGVVSATTAVCNAPALQDGRPVRSSTLPGRRAAHSWLSPTRI